MLISPFFLPNSLCVCKTGTFLGSLRIVSETNACKANAHLSFLHSSCCGNDKLARDEAHSGCNRHFVLGCEVFQYSICVAAELI